VRLQQHAGVEVLHHDIQTAPDHLSAALLAKHGSAAPKPSRSSNGGNFSVGFSVGNYSGCYKGSIPRAGYKSGGYKGGTGSEGGSSHGPRKSGTSSYTKGKSYAGKRATAAR
jgi:hypothetical protein